MTFHTNCTNFTECNGIIKIETKSRARKNVKKLNGSRYVNWLHGKRHKQKNGFIHCRQSMLHVHNGTMVQQHFFLSLFLFIKVIDAIKNDFRFVLYIFYVDLECLCICSLPSSTNVNECGFVGVNIRIVLAYSDNSEL